MKLSAKARNRLFTAGYLTKGVVYLLMGGFAVATVIGSSRSSNGPKTVINWVGENPFGKLFMGVIAIGLLAYCCWRWYMAIADTKSEGHEGSGLIKRLGWAVSGTAYGALSFYAFERLFTGRGGKGAKEDMIGLLLAQSWGQLAVSAIGVIVAGVGLYQLFRALKDKHMEDVGVEHLNEGKRKVIQNAGRIGLMARAVVYGVIAYFLFRAGTMSDASQFKGIGEALSFLEKGSLGAMLLAATGTGLLAYGSFMLVRANYERV
ncbi:DUF1206 domain-containing protein [Neolewinella agarilytica]|uniref:DUF1206 domain-containing protein n=1 Tax=Neolewinella agarilytica TaxID=478744 RepID=UPI002356C22A|nr:DUF1206 domain-containing protein [Neolewinella agarilytica]